MSMIRENYIYIYIYIGVFMIILCYSKLYVRVYELRTFVLHIHIGWIYSVGLMIFITERSICYKHTTI